MTSCDKCGQQVPPTETRIVQPIPPEYLLLCTRLGSYWNKSVTARREMGEDIPFYDFKVDPYLEVTERKNKRMAALLAGHLKDILADNGANYAKLKEAIDMAYDLAKEL